MAAARQQSCRWCSSFLSIASLLLLHQSCIASDSADDALLDWVTAKGGFAHLKIGPVKGSGLRGTTATRELKEGEAVALIPAELGVHLGSIYMNGPENAALLLSKLVKDPALREGHAPYWASLPPPNTTVFCKVLFTPEHMGMLQSADLVDDVQLGVQQAREVFSDTRVWWERLLNMGPSVFLSKELGPQHNVSFESLLHHTCLVNSYAFGCKSAWIFQETCLLPLLDMLNHAPEGLANARITENANGSFSCLALTGIHVGDEVTHTYSGALERPDHALLQYGFVVDAAEPLLAGVDHLRAGDTDDSLYRGDPWLDRKTEIARLRALLASLPTTAAEDAALLQGRSGRMDSREAAILQYRLVRKKALNQTIERLEEQLRYFDRKGGKSEEAEL